MIGNAMAGLFAGKQDNGSKELHFSGFKRAKTFICRMFGLGKNAIRQARFFHDTSPVDSGVYPITPSAQRKAE